SAYVGSNPTPATTSENGPLAAETRSGGPSPSRHDMYQCVSLRVDAWQCARTYGVQRPGKTSGSNNRSLWRPAPVLSPYVGAGTLARLLSATHSVGWFFSVMLAPGGWIIPRHLAGLSPWR